MRLKRLRREPQISRVIFRVLAVEGRTKLKNRTTDLSSERKQ